MGINGLQDNTPITTIEIQIKEKNEILKGLEKTYETLLEFKKSKNSELVVLLNNKIVKIKPTTL
jgi:sulfur carrier protein ThiS